MAPSSKTCWPVENHTLLLLVQHSCQRSQKRGRHQELQSLPRQGICWQALGGLPQSVLGR